METLDKTDGLKIEWADISRVKPYPRNPRKNDESISAVAASIREFGWRQPIVVDAEWVIVIGHTRWKAAKRLQLKQVPVHVAAGLTPEQIKALRVADNSSGSKSAWDLDLLRYESKDLAGFDLAAFGLDVDLLGKKKETSADAEPETDEAKALNEKWGVQSGDIWLVGEGHRLLCGNSTKDDDVTVLFAGAAPDIMVTDPPYGVEYDASWRKAAFGGQNTATGKVTNDNRAKWCGTYLRSRAPVAYVWHGAIHGPEVAADLDGAGYVLRSQIIWAKRRFPISRGDYHWAHEPCWYAVKDGNPGGYVGGRKQSTLWADVSDGLKKDGPDPIYALLVDETTVRAFPASATTVWTLKHDKACGGGHSTQKPLECMARPIRNHGEQGDIVYDPFLGSGTTMVAAQNLSRKCYGIEISPAYCAVILQRMADAFPGIDIRRG